jgi:hypothetical protein
LSGVASATLVRVSLSTSGGGLLVANGIVRTVALLGAARRRPWAR